MAKPRIFISSTFYDLKHVRYDLEGFLKGMGYEPIMNDRGNIPYSSERTLEDSCYDEVSRCDILVGIIGNKYGSDSNEENYSISMKEIKTAIKNNKQVFIFVEKAVLNENELYIANKEKDINYVAVDNICIHKFIEEIKGLSINNAMIPFESSNDITDYLKEQFAGLFQRLLQERATVTEQTTYYDLKEISNELKRTITEMDENNRIFADKFENTVFAQNFFTKQLFELMGIKEARIFAKNKTSLYEVLYVMGYTLTDSEENEFFLFIKTDNTERHILKIAKNVFDEEGFIKNIRIKEIDNNLSYVTELIDDDDDLPF